CILHRSRWPSTRASPRSSARAACIRSGATADGPTVRSRTTSSRRARSRPDSTREADLAKKNDALSGRAARYLRGLGHALDPIVAIGKHGITDGLVKQTTDALLQHELVKVRVMSEAPVDRKDAAAE